MLPTAALEHERAQADLHDLVGATVRRAWRPMRTASGSWESIWRNGVALSAYEALTAAQEASLAQADVYAAAVLSELDLTTPGAPALNVDALLGVTGDGRDLADATYGAVVHAARTYADVLPDATSTEASTKALDAGEDWLTGLAESLIAEAERAALSVAIAAEPKAGGYVRMVEPGACSRCVVLAGRFYRWNQGFDRHPRCRCTHIPAAENADDYRTNPNKYFDSLTATEQDRIFTKAGAEAVRLGADVSQVVNARRGMSTAQQNPRDWIPKGRLKAVEMHGRDVFVTTEGVTKRGIYGKTRGNKPVRLMPESILSLARDRDDAIRLLKVYGYLT